jgi:hypothetical protein
MKEDTQGPGVQSWLQERLKTLDALFQKFGPDGLKDASLADASLLLSSKELAYRDAPKSRDVSEDQKAANRDLEIQIKALAAYLNAQLAGASLYGSRIPKLFGPSGQQQDKPKPKANEMER